jgi:hypothetical protein
MKVSGPSASGSAAPSGASAARPASGGPAFAPSTSQAVGLAAAAPANALGSVGALIALQEANSPLDRRRRATRRAGRILDVLDEMKLGLLEGRTRPDAFDRLRQLVREERAATDHPAMEGVLDEIDLRAAVELAKLEMSRAAA